MNMHTIIAHTSGSTGSPCAACKFLRRKCTVECVFAPYFPPDQPQRFVNVHKIFGASNVTKLLNEVPLPQREDAVNSLVYEAEARMKDPVYGCVGAISLLQQKIAQLQTELAIARSELHRYATVNSHSHGALMNVHGNHLTGPVSLGHTIPNPLPLATLRAVDHQQHAGSFYSPREQMMEYARASAALINLSEDHSYQDGTGSSSSHGSHGHHGFKMEPA